jgi:hypothetical protein
VRAPSVEEVRVNDPAYPYETHLDVKLVEGAGIVPTGSGSAI